MRAIIADDEEQLRSYLKSRLSEVWPELVICGEAENGREALKVIEKEQPHIAFLDIRMPGLSGMEVARKIAGACRVVFITAYDQYAVEAFESEAIDYLLKPVTNERLKNTVNRIKKQIAASSTAPSDLSEVVERLMTGLQERHAPGYLQWIRAQQGHSTRLIPVDEVSYFKASEKYTMVMTAVGESLISKPIKELADELDPDKFWRIHRGTIVNAGCIDKVSRSLTGRGVIKLKDRPELLTVSRTYIHIFKQM
ncbi:MAG: response regulator transcription factor [Deltaproteobacteria bacterium]|nr:response regulator transcription factor [Deltaproteobacteria bacterium]MBW2616244.1 response regulator transcription factor [Deltaproteobacteria bacterium]